MRLLRLGRSILPLPLLPGSADLDYPRGLNCADETVIGAIEKIAPHQQMRHPLPPQERKPLGGVFVEDPDGNREGEGPEIKPEIAIKCRCIPLHQRGDEIPARLAHQDLHHPDGETESEQGHHQHPRFAPVPINEESVQELGQPPEFLGRWDSHILRAFSEQPEG